ncbi:hypothetical protein CHMI_00022 [Cellulomonas hominis]|nr:hypothetical protein CHMI_00022 [Cellulomonas hominis]
MITGLEDNAATAVKGPGLSQENAVVFARRESAPSTWSPCWTAHVR